MIRNTLTLCLVLLSVNLFAQEYAKYEVSTTNPFGLLNPEAPEQVKDFAPMIGRCLCQSETRNQDGTWAEPTEMMWTFKYIMNGLGVQDETVKADGKHSGSIRQYHADSARWYVHWYGSASPTTVLSTWEGNASTEKDKIVLYRDQAAPNGMEGYYRLTFYDFTDSGYKWAGEWTDKAESIVYPTWKITCTRKED
ncbi:MAG: hypothetical protein HEP71_03505 [Roseivirga sp.]|nr:hypothetical protein [Roseivirga sp.]